MRLTILNIIRSLVLILLVALAVHAALASHTSEIRMQHIRIPSEIQAGEPIHVSIGLRQTDGPGLKRIKTKVYIPQTGEIAYASELRRLRSTSEYADMFLDTNKDMEPGEYLVRMYSSVRTTSEDGNQKRTKTIRHRMVQVW
ncbi:MAG: hypothetical protein AABX52_04785 [Nanoarchaeota archaeon]